MSKFNEKTSNKTENLAGGKAFSKQPKEELAFAVVSSFLENKHYESGDDRIARIKALVPQVGYDFASRLAFATRTIFNMRSTSHVLIGEIAKIYKGKVKSLIPVCTPRPDDLLEIASYIGKPLPAQVKKGIAIALENYSGYQLAKYRGEGKAWSMVDLFNLTHPKGNKPFWKDFVDGNLKSTDTWESEVSKDASKETWERLIFDNKMGYMATLRNLNNFIKYGISKEAKQKVIEKLIDPIEVGKSKQLPFRFYTAFNEVSGDVDYSDAISEAMDISVGNIEKMDGKTLIAVDTSGSMLGRPIDIAGIFAGAIVKRSDSDLVLYNTSLKQLVVSRRTPVIDIAKNIRKEADGGGTSTPLVFEFAEKQPIYDRIIILSDNESWAGGYHSQTVQGAYNSFKSVTGTDPFIYAIDIAGYGTHDIQSNKVFHICGWSEKVLDFVNIIEKKEGIVSWIEKLELPCI